MADDNSGWRTISTAEEERRIRRAQKQATDTSVRRPEGPNRNPPGTSSDSGQQASNSPVMATQPSVGRTAAQPGARASSTTHRQSDGRRGTAPSLGSTASNGQTVGPRLLSSRSMSSQTQHSAPHGPSSTPLPRNYTRSDDLTEKALEEWNRRSQVGPKLNKKEMNSEPQGNTGIKSSIRAPTVVDRFFGPGWLYDGDLTEDARASKLKSLERSRKIGSAPEQSTRQGITAEIKPGFKVVGDNESRYSRYGD